ncbi:hypothetical protein JAAARDRAFT_38598 [Jaapia argillacea MUCL 33604]|uniref:NADH:flavin oxidoreductase/NADH oxidase N-terminal domain-containing protein n=1 Tax=Jaapia argillacea MUCL 33604 TaxID=933084 RepID=A0A067PT37_9AGAM|nr:hypothetical protein JAAARDRAFT_38598 [Jaapia argillacea MUCL 33604]
MCLFSAQDGKFTAALQTHLESTIAQGGPVPGLFFVEATAVLPEGRLTLQDVGLWEDDQIESMKNLVDFAHSNGHRLIGIQLSHAGQKEVDNAPSLLGGGVMQNSMQGGGLANSNAQSGAPPASIARQNKGVGVGCYNGVCKFAVLSSGNTGAAQGNGVSGVQGASGNKMALGSPLPSPQYCGVWNGVPYCVSGVVGQPVASLNKEVLLTVPGSGDSGSDSESTQHSSNASDSGSDSTKYLSDQSDAGSDSTKHPNDGSESDGSDLTKHSGDKSDSGSDSMNDSNDTDQHSTHDLYGHIQPTEMTKEAIDQVVRAFEDAARRAVKAGFDVVEINCGLGSLFGSFLDPNVNRRTDGYGGTFEGRVRFVLEVVDRVRAVIPGSMPLFLRVSPNDEFETESHEGPSLTTDDAVKLAGILPDHGVDLIDVSFVGGSPVQPNLNAGQSSRSDASIFSAAVKQAVGSKLLVGSVGGYTDGKVVEETLEQGKADVILVGRGFLRNPALVQSMLEDLGVATLDGKALANGGAGLTASGLLSGVAGQAKTV